METKTVVLAAHGVVAAGLLAVGAVSLLAGNVAPFVLRAGTAALVGIVGYVIYQTQ